MDSPSVVLTDEPAADWLARDDVLAVVELDEAEPAGTDPRHLSLRLPHLGGPAREVWLAEGPLRPAQCGADPALRSVVGKGAQWLWYALDSVADADLAAVSEQACGALMDARAPGHRFVRMWNVLGGINEGSGDAERYRQFVRGRHSAFAARGLAGPDYPAATAVGARGRGLLLAALATGSASCNIENPRQMSAWEYPRQYGPSPPSFARATQLDHGRVLLVSGTGSVCGHASRHDGDIDAQLDEVMLNIDALSSSAAALRPQALKVFLRHATDLPRVRAALAQRIAADTPLAWLRGDLCRRELLLEIEGVYARL